VCAGLGPAVRWAGISVVATGVVLLLVYGAGTRRERRVRAVAWGAVALAPAIVSAIANRGAGSGSDTARELAWHPIDWSQLQKGFDTIGSWFLPRQLPDRWVVGLALALAAVVVAVSFVVRRGGVAATRALLADAGPAVVVPGAFCVIYVATIVLSMSVFDAATPLDVRILSPLYVALVATVVGAVGRWYVAQPRAMSALRTGAAVLVVVVALVGLRALTTATGSQEARLGFAAPSWHRSSLMRHIDALPAHDQIVTNAPEAVYLQTGRPARGLPSKFSSTSLVRRADYQQQLSALAEHLRAHPGYIAMFDRVKGRPWLPRTEELRADERFRVVATLSDGVLLAADEE
jgi:hypothetical protein